jgi:glucose dehydrogenase
VRNWSELTVDEARGIAHIRLDRALRLPGGNRIGDNLFSNSIVALDARTGKRLWHFKPSIRSVGPRLPAGAEAADRVTMAATSTCSLDEQTGFL